ncbi:MAG: hypothetical protein SWH68_13920 [Thermodesulfobacteriota bacterium]|nr:hypothetical protein [Thermodesulfobacteriota bacterium]
MSLTQKSGKIAIYGWALGYVAWVYEKAGNDGKNTKQRHRPSRFADFLNSGILMKNRTIAIGRIRVQTRGRTDKTDKPTQHLHPYDSGSDVDDCAQQPGSKCGRHGRAGG